VTEREDRRLDPRAGPMPELADPAPDPVPDPLPERLAELAAQPPARWRPALDAAFPGDPALVAQALLWLSAGERPPALDGRYVLAARLDVGASAEVWQAFDKKLGRQIAIKLFHAEQAPALAEARAACDVISDHVVRVLDVAGGERPYIVMELIGEHDPRRGEQLPGASAAVTRPRSIDEAVRWVRDVARGVHDAHLRDVFHRDLKPHNVLITPVSRRARIADFGLAARASSFAGTPEYMAPEQAHGLPALSAARPDDRARLVALDVWGLGALAYDLVTGRPPWHASGSLAAWELAGAGAPPPPAAHAPPRLRRVIERAMALRPADRYASAAELGDELDAYLALRPTRLDRSRALRATLWFRRNPQLSLTAAAAALLAVLTLATSVAVVRLRDRARQLAAEVAREEADNRALESRAAIRRRELATAETELAGKTAALAQLERELADEQTSYRAIIASRDKALHDADAATRQLVEQLTLARSDRTTAELGRTLYESYWSSARQEADRAASARDQALHERDAARAERDQTKGERDAAISERDRLQADLDRARADLARFETELAQRAARIQALERRLAGSPADAGVQN